MSETKPLSKIIVTPDDRRDLEMIASRIIYTAWQASAVVEFGALQDEGPEVSEAEVFTQARDVGDYDGFGAKPNRINCEYVLGRCMKTRLDIDPAKNTVTVAMNGEPQGYRQTWAHKYKTYTALVNTALRSLEGVQAKVELA